MKATIKENPDEYIAFASPNFGWMVGSNIVFHIISKSAIPSAFYTVLAGFRYLLWFRRFR